MLTRVRAAPVRGAARLGRDRTPGPGPPWHDPAARDRDGDDRQEDTTHEPGHRGPPGGRRRGRGGAPVGRCVPPARRPRRGAARGHVAREKLAQLASVWIGAELGGGNVAPMQEAFATRRPSRRPAPTASATSRGRSAPPGRPGRGGAAARRAARRELIERTRLGIPAHRARGVPDRASPPGGDGLPDAAGLGRDLRPRSWSSGWPRAIGASMRAVGVHQGLAPVLDVVRDSAGAGWRRRSARTRTSSARSAPRTSGAWSPPAWSPRSSTSSATRPRAAGRNHAPVSIGPRELRRRDARPVRDGAPRGRRPLGDELLHRDRRRARRPPTRRCSPACCATSGASTGTVVVRLLRRSPSCRPCTASPPTPARPARSP